MSALKGQIQIIPQEIFQASTTQNTDLGAQATSGDGRIFRYALAGTTALVAGNLLASSATSSGNLNLAPLAAGTLATIVTTSSTLAAAANQFVGGTLGIRTTPGNGLVYKIKSHNTVTSGTVAFVLEDPIQVSLTTASRIDVIANPYWNVLANATTATAMPIGVAPFAVPASNYFWVQTRGPAAVLQDGATNVGLPLGPSAVTAGAVTTSAGTSFAVAVAPMTTVTAVNSTVYLTLE